MNIADISTNSRVWKPTLRHWLRRRLCIYSSAYYRSLMLFNKYIFWGFSSICWI